MAAAKSTKVGKENAQPKKVDVEEEEEETERSTDKKSGTDSKKVSHLTSENDRLRKQRDAFSKQFDDLSRVRNTDSEKLFEKYKQNVEVQSKAQNEIIANMTTLNEKQSARIASLEKQLAVAQKNAEAAAAAGPSTAKSAEPVASTSDLSKSEQKELKALRDEVAVLRKGVKEKDQKIVQLEKEYQAEVAQSRTLQASTRGAPNLAASTSLPPLTEESEKDAVCLSLYEDMTELQIINVKIKRDSKTGKEATFNCLHTNHDQKRSLHFKIRTYQELSQELVAQKAENPWVRQIHYQPENLANETDKEFVKRLGDFGEQFTIERKMLAAMWDDLKKRVEGDEEDDE